MTKSEKIGAKIALLNGLTFGLGIPIILIFILLLSADGLLGWIGIGAILSYNYIIVSLVLLLGSFPIALWTFGKRNARNIDKGKSIIKTSAEFSFATNVIVWIVFLISQYIIGNAENNVLVSLFALGAIVVFGILTTYTIGYYIVRLTKEKLKACVQHGV